MNSIFIQCSKIMTVPDDWQETNNLKRVTNRYENYRTLIAVSLNTYWFYKIYECYENYNVRKTGWWCWCDDDNEEEDNENHFIEAIASFKITLPFSTIRSIIRKSEIMLISIKVVSVCIYFTFIQLGDCAFSILHFSVFLSINFHN